MNESDARSLVFCDFCGKSVNDKGLKAVLDDHTFTPTKGKKEEINDNREESDDAFHSFEDQCEDE